MATTKKAETSAEKQTTKKAETSAENDVVHYQEWDVKVKPKGEYEKLKISRKVVKISEQEAETLNRGVLQGGNSYAKMYFLPE